MSLLQMSVSGTALILLTVLVRAAGVERLPKGTFRFLWGLALARLLIPVSLPLPAAVMEPLEHAVPVLEEQFPTAQTVERLPSETTASASPDTARVPWHGIWLCGTSALSLLFAVSYGRFFRAFRRAEPVERETARAWLNHRRIRRPLSIRQSDRVRGPLTFGILRPVILLPDTTDWSDWETLRFVLYHEYVHVRRFDAAAKFLTAAALCVHWFNPAVWLLYALANRDMELGCDEAVIRHYGREARLPYVTALLNMEERKTASAVPAFSARAAEERVRAVMKTRPPTRSAALLSGLTAILAAAVFVLTGAAFAFGTVPDGMIPLNAYRTAYTGDEGFTKTDSGLVRVLAEMPVYGGTLMETETRSRFDFRGYDTTYALMFLPITWEEPPSPDGGHPLYIGDVLPENVFFDPETKTIQYDVPEETDFYADPLSTDVQQSGKTLHCVYDIRNWGKFDLDFGAWMQSVSDHDSSIAGGP